jgi:membrane protease YdiL (CAAX protease family)
MHGPGAAAFAALAGILLGAAVVRFGDLAMVVAAHAVYNLGAIIRVHSLARQHVAGAPRGRQVTAPLATVVTTTPAAQKKDA